MRIGAHESIAGGLALAFDRGRADGAEAIQIFTKSSRQWDAKPIADADAVAFRAARAGVPVLVHGSYLINLGAEPGEVRRRSLAAFRDELDRCEQLGVEWLVTHPGAHADEATGLRLIAEAVAGALRATRGCGVGVLLEVTAGQGTCLGHRFEHLARLLDTLGRPERVGVCLDSCHLFAAGYDLATDQGYADTMGELDRVVGLAHVRALHLNDSLKGRGCRVDRHESIGRGTLGQATFRRLVTDPRLAGLPAVLETPEGRWKEEIAFLKALRAGKTPKLPPRRVASIEPVLRRARLPEAGAGRAAEPTRSKRPIVEKSREPMKAALAVRPPAPRGGSEARAARPKSPARSTGSMTPRAAPQGVSGHRSKAGPVPRATAASRPRR